MDIRNCLRQSNHEVIEFFILGDIRREASKTATLNFQRANLEVFRTLVGRVLWESVLKGKRDQEGWSFLKEEFLEAQELAVPLCHKISHLGRLVWKNGKFLLRLRKKKEFTCFERRNGQLRESTKKLLGYAGKNN